MRNKTYKSADPGDIVVVEGRTGFYSGGTESSITTTSIELFPGIVLSSKNGRCKVQLEMGQIVEVDEGDLKLSFLAW